MMRKINFVRQQLSVVQKRKAAIRKAQQLIRDMEDGYHEIA